MKLQNLEDLQEEEIEALISNITFFQSLKGIDYDQYIQLRSLTQVIELAPKEVISELVAYLK